ncbi:MAG: hypothetical protein IJX62_05145 [Clostridia bacterium]|nr:hypothetical protein [Clostridia bacterium]
MINGRARIFAFLMVAVIFTAILTPLPASATTSVENEAAEEPYYGRWVLSTLPNAEALLYAYDQLVEGIEACAETVTVYDGTHPLTEAELKTVMDAYRRDQAGHFWYGSSYQYSYTSASIVSVSPAYTMSGEVLTAAKAAFEQRTAEILGGIRQNMSDFEKELYLHDTLAAGVVYRESDHAHDAYGALVEGIAVCEGYAEALQYLCQRVGLTSFLAVGSSVNPSTGQPEGHAWNLIEIDGFFYHVDLTWNDQGENLYHAYFNLSDQQITRDHVMESTAYPMPQASSDTAHYFKIKGGAVSATGCTARQIGEMLKAGGLKTHVYVTDDPAAFATWYAANIRDIITEIGIQGRCSYGYSQLGNELILTVTPLDCQHTALTSVAPNPASCTQNGNTAYYVCTCGKWFSDSAGTREITGTNSVVLVASHTWDLRLEDADHLLREGEGCLEQHLYGYGCSVCGEVSTVVTFHGQARGDHVYDGSSYEMVENYHREKCSVCGEGKDYVPHEDGDANGHCDDCGRSLSGASTEESSDPADTGEGALGSGTSGDTESPGTEKDTDEDRTTGGTENGGQQSSVNWEELLQKPEVLVIGGVLIGVILFFAVIGAIRRG